MLHSRPRPCSVTPFNQILIKLVRFKQFEAVISLNSQMLLSGVRPDHFTLSIVINCYCHLNKMGFALSVLTHFLKLGLQLNVVTFNTLIHGFVLGNRMADAARVFSIMVSGGHCQPNVITFNTLIKGYCATGNNTATVRLLGKMEDYGCQPNIVLYSTIIDRLTKHSLVDEAKDLLSEMIGRGIVPNVVTYSSLIQGACNLGNWKEIWRLSEEMRSQGIFPNVLTFSISVDGYCKEGKVDKAETVVQIMVQKGIEPNTITYSSLMDGHCLRGQMNKAQKVFDLMSTKRSMVDVHSCNILINGYIKCKMIDKAYKVFKEMPRKRIAPNTITYSTLIDGMFKAGRLEEAEKLFSKMQECGQLPDLQTYCIIFNGLCNNQQIPEAIELLKEMEGSKLKPNIVAYSTLIEALVKAGKVESAKEIFSGLSSRGVKPGVWPYTIRGEVARSPAQIGSSIIYEFTSWSQAVKRDKTPEAPTHQRTIDWRPAPGSLVIHSDAAVSNQSACFGSIICDYQGNLRVALGDRVRCSLSPRAAELRAITLGLEWAADRRWRVGRVFSDCLQAIQLVEADGGCLAEDGELVELIRHLLCILGDVKLEYIPRAQNRVADTIAKSMASLNGFHIWLGSGPPWLSHVIANDLNPTTPSGSSLLFSPEVTNSLM